MRKRGLPDIPDREGSEYDRALKEFLEEQYPLELPTYTYQQLIALTAKNFNRHMVVCSNGDAGDECLAYCDGFNWKVVALGVNISLS